MEKMNREKQGMKYELFSFVKILILCLIIAFGIKTFIAQPVFVEGSSMYPTLEDGEFGFTNLIGLSLEGVNRGDIVIVQEGNEYWVKRVIGMPNETIECHNGNVYIDGEALIESYTKTPTNLRYDIKFPVTVPEGCVFVMGDNRNKSIDSRSSTIGVNGMIDERYILGKAIFRVYPFSRAGSLE